MTVLSTALMSARGPLVVIKADDLWYRPGQNVFGNGWNRFIEIAQAEDIKISIGIVCKSLDEGAPEYFDRIRNLHASGRIEFWNHGYTHGRNKETGESEFKGPSFEAQLATLERSQRLAREKLGFAFRTFGSPFNAHDASTERALRELPEITHWMYGPEGAELLPGQRTTLRWVDMEQPVHHPDFEGFKRDFEAQPSRPYYILQAHPGGWDAARFEEFQKIIHFLKERNAEFVTPSELTDRLLTGAVPGGE